MAGSMDREDVISFIAHFSKLKEWSDDDPEGLPELARKDGSLQEVCNNLFCAGHALRMNESRRRKRYKVSEDTDFLKAWRDFEERYERIIGRVWLADALPDLDGDEPSQVSAPDDYWDTANGKAHGQAHDLEAALDFAYDQAAQEDRWSREFSESIEDGIAAWEHLKNHVGLEPRGVFRRQELIPFVLVPRHVDAQRGSSEKLSIYQNLQQAHDAFTFGTPFAALALMRSILEAVLRDHYNAEGKDLEERIRAAGKMLPRGASVARLHRLRKLANAVLHLDKERDAGLSKIEPTQLEREIVSHLLALRALIEGAPSSQLR